MKKIIFGIIIAVLVIGIWFPVIPFPVKKGYHGIGGEFCGIVYNKECDETTVKLLTYSEVKYIVTNHYY